MPGLSMMVLETQRYIIMSNEKTLSKRQEEYAIRRVPSLIEYFGFCTFFAGWITGPSVEFNEYMNFIECKVQQFLFMISIRLTRCLTVQKQSLKRFHLPLGVSYFT
jgi:hypothetical protein